MRNKYKITLLSLLAVVCILSITSIQAQTKKKKGLYKKYIAPEERGYGTAGCGLGSIVWGATDGNEQILAATTNGTSGTQTSGMTSGTSNCDEVYVSIRSYRQSDQEAFAAVNYSSLAQEMAVGEGEKIRAFSALLGCSDFRRFANFSRAHYASLFEAKTETNEASSEFLSRLREQIRADHTLASNCNFI